MKILQKCTNQNSNVNKINDTDAGDAGGGVFVTHV